MGVQRHKMSLSVDYVKDWTAQDALRELFQNSIDWANWSWEYKQETLTIRSKSTSLDKKFLLLGMSEKKPGSIGLYGEGFKLAMLVLCRLGHKPYVLTGTDSWEPKLINSKTYGVRQLVFDVHDGQPEVKDLIFVVPGVPMEMFSELQCRNLHVRRPTTGWHTSFGHILPMDYAGKIFVGGLYVCTVKDLRHGYDFNPTALKLDRDRRMVNDFDVYWRSCQMWKELEEYDYILSLIKDGAPDVKYLDSFTYSVSNSLADKAAEEFLAEHGTDAIPVVDNYDIAKAKEQGHEKIIIVPKITTELLDKSRLWERPPARIVPKRPREILLDFYNDYSDDWTPLMQLQFTVILNLAEGWHS
jgi:hypothetical protein